MSKETSKRLVLGFDAGCFTCAEMAQKVEERVGGKLEVADLRDPEVMKWRKEAIGEDAPWAPTLFELGGGSVKAWPGKRMGLKLSYALGLSDTWRVMQVLGEVSVTPGVAEALPTASTGSGMSRGQFLKGVGGAAVAMGMLSSFGGIASANTIDQNKKRLRNRRWQHSMAAVPEIGRASVVSFLFAEPRSLYSCSGRERVFSSAFSRTHSTAPGVFSHSVRAVAK